MAITAHYHKFNFSNTTIGEYIYISCIFNQIYYDYQEDKHLYFKTFTYRMQTTTIKHSYMVMKKLNQLFTVKLYWYDGYTSFISSYLQMSLTNAN